MKNKLIYILCLISVNLHAQMYYIPTTVHVLYFDASEDMPFTEVEALINHANLGLRGLSQNNTVSRAIFDTLWTDTNIQLCLATTDEYGFPTDGIVHRQMNTPVGSGDFFRTKGESTPWNTDLYLNIWISSMGAGSELQGGIATSPTVPHTNFPNPYIGIMLNKDSYNYSQILLHEIGHFFGLEHLYFDYIDDTPCSNNAIDPEPDCIPDFLTLNTCSDEAPFWGEADPPDMIENYMEYYGNCAKMFTKGQKIEMRDYTETYYSEMINAQLPCAAILANEDFSPERNESRVYPNPTFGEITLEHKNKFSYQLISAHGKLLRAGIGDKKLDLNLNDLQKGIYLIRIQDNRKSITYKVLKL